MSIRALNDAYFEETEQLLGEGSFAEVRVVRYKGKEYAGKYFKEMTHTMFDKCFNECSRCLSIEHPNVVKTIGLVTKESGKNERHHHAVRLILVMERLTINLSQFVKQEKQLPDYVKLSILYDVSKGLQFLHSKNIIHRDLSANNVLLTETLTAKISDLGQSKNVDNEELLGQTVNPGTPIYMAPEARRASRLFNKENRAEYNFSIDVYSYGILMIHVYLHDFPIPKSHLGYVVDKDDPHIFRLCPPIEDFKEPIEKAIPPNHPLHSLVCKCLEVDSGKRPSPDGLLTKIRKELNSRNSSAFEKVLRYATAYVNTLTEEEDIFKNDTETKEQDYCKLREENKRLKMKVESLERETETLRSKISIITENGWQLVNESQSIVDEESGLLFQTVEAYVEPQRDPSTITYKEDQKKDFIDDHKKLRITSALQQSSIADTHFEGAKAVLLEGKIFIGRATDTIHSYDCKTKKWAALPKVPVEKYAIASYQGQLVIVGGSTATGDVLSGNVYCYNNREWLDGIVPITNEDGEVENVHFPAINTPRKNAAAVGFENFLIVFGGEGKGGFITSGYLKSVEICCGIPKKWCKGPDLPQKDTLMQCIVADGYFYLLHSGGRNIMYCSLNELVKTATVGFSSKEMWHSIERHVPYARCSLVVYNNTLLVLAGASSDGHVYAYDPKETKWVKVYCISTLPTIKNACCLQYRQGELFLCGGYIGMLPNQIAQSGYLLTVEESVTDEKDKSFSHSSHSKTSSGKKKP